MNNRTYVTTTIPYVNARSLVGFSLEMVQADALARYKQPAAGADRGGLSRHG